MFVEKQRDTKEINLNVFRGSVEANMREQQQVE